MEFSKNYIKANTAYQQGHFLLAITIFNRELAIKSKNHLAYLGKAKSLIKLGKPDAARLNFQKCILNTPEENKFEFIEGCNSFLLANESENEAYYLIRSHQSRLSTAYKEEYILNLILEEEKEAFLQFARQLKARENEIITQNIILDPLIASALKEKLEAFYWSYLETEREKLNRQFSSNEAFINGLDGQFEELKMEFNQLKTRFSETFPALGMGFEALNESEFFFEERLYQALWKAEEKRNAQLIKNHIEERKADFDDYHKKTKRFQAYLFFADSNQLLNENIHWNFYDLDLDLDLNQNLLEGTNFQEVVDFTNDLPAISAKVETAIAEMEWGLNETFDKLLTAKKVFRAARIAKFLMKSGQRKPIYKKVIALAKRKRNIFAFSAVLTPALLIIIGLFIYNRSVENKLYEQAINQNTHNKYLNYIETYPEGRYISEIKSKDQQLLYQKAVESQRVNDINSLVKLYPKSQWLKTIEFKSTTNLKFNLKTLKGEHIKANYFTYSVPKGLPLRYEAYSNEEMIDYGFFQVVENCVIDTNTMRNFKKDQVYFCNAIGLNVRKNGFGSEILAEISSGYPVKYLGEKSEKTNNADFFEERINDFYYHIELLDGTRGWVHGGGLKDMQFNDSSSYQDYRKVNEEKTIFTLNRP